MRWSIFSSRFQLLNVKIDKTNPASNPLEIYEIILYEKNKHLFSVMTKIYEWNLQVSKNTQIIKTTSSLTSYKLDYILSLIFWWCRNIV